MIFTISRCCFAWLLVGRTGGAMSRHVSPCMLVITYRRAFSAVLLPAGPLRRSLCFARWAGRRRDLEQYDDGDGDDGCDWCFWGAHFSLLGRTERSLFSPGADGPTVQYQMLVLLCMMLLLLLMMMMMLMLLLMLLLLMMLLMLLLQCCCC